jgi:hypothetical protein
MSWKRTAICSGNADLNNVVLVAAVDVQLAQKELAVSNITFNNHHDGAVATTMLRSTAYASTMRSE